LMAIGWRSLLPVAMSIFLFFSIFFYLTDSFYLSAQVQHNHAVYYLPDVNLYLGDSSIYMLDEISRSVYTEIAELSKFNWTLNEYRFYFEISRTLFIFKLLVVHYVLLFTLKSDDIIKKIHKLLLPGSRLKGSTLPYQKIS
jgi:hypothetical protein